MTEKTDDPAVLDFLRRIGAKGRERREVISHVCPSCGKSFEAWRPAVYCSGACRQRAFQAKRKAAAAGE